MTDNLQLNAEGKLKHFLTIEGLSKGLLTEILDTAESFAGVSEHQVKKVPLLRGKTIVNLFFEKPPPSPAHLRPRRHAAVRRCDQYEYSHLGYLKRRKPA